ncbi:hypothetical protein ASE36_00970 [Rhizobium sp. Root274]|uniref:DUF6455 family protein n=1 Tax=unclassified Rhizobium TaxID=2613769 RepID=UPI000714A135|nr:MULTISPECIES: DUF6455 family protein [unclassified Rhizobium]KQW30903.1 hypothetical protein ASC71_00975 [Rhizobium sp. Root1240]KRD32448.1 hypothetical protein ASE36_00970 [Rhizobium sp. Root274]
MTLNIADPVRHTMQQILSWFAQGFEASTEADVLANLDQAQIEALAEDCGLSPHQLVALVKAGPHAADEMPQVMRALNIDPDEVDYQMRKLFRDMQIACSNCQSKDQCRHDLQAGTIGKTFVDYCNNAESLNALRASPDLLMER